MASGLALTGIVAYGAAETGLYASLIDTPMLFWGVTLAPLALVLLLSFRVEKMSLGAAKTAFWAYAALEKEGSNPSIPARTNSPGLRAQRSNFVSGNKFVGIPLYPKQRTFLIPLAKPAEVPISDIDDRWRLSQRRS